MDKIKYRTIQQAWQNFDRSTALGCAQKKIPFERSRMEIAWDYYNSVLERYGILPFPPLVY